MEIRSDGQMSWYIGAEGWHGTYAMENGVIHAQLTSDSEQSARLWNFRIVTENETATLEMDYENMTIYWIYGDQKNMPAIRNNESRYDAAYPGADVVEIVNLRGDKTTIYKLADGTYIDRIERYFTYNGTDTWTNEDGVPLALGLNGFIVNGGAPKETYLECMEAYLSHETEYGWYLCIDRDRIIGSMGVIKNDFHDRKDLSPNVCAVYTEVDYRCKGIAGNMLNIVVRDLKAKGIAPVYLVTDHMGFYERYGWEFLCMVQGDGESKKTGMYIHE